MIAKELNKLNTNLDMSKLKTTSITNWLIDIGILFETEINDKKYKLPTKMGEDIGLYIEERIGYNGEYHIVEYPKQSQKFIIDKNEELIVKNIEKNLVGDFKYDNQGEEDEDDDYKFGYYYIPNRIEYRYYKDGNIIFKNEQFNKLVASIYYNLDRGYGPAQENKMYEIIKDWYIY